jgi:AraC-like DNA-binding protein
MELATTVCEMAGQIPEPRDSLRNRRRLARRAETWMREQLSQSVRVPDVCLALRVSRRELEYAFRAIFDQSPRDFLHALRLHQARRVLLEGKEARPLLEIALACGLTHAGRFSADYRRLFGEYPSQTSASIIAPPGSRDFREHVQAMTSGFLAILE